MDTTSVTRCNNICDQMLFRTPECTPEWANLIEQFTWAVGEGDTGRQHFHSREMTTIFPTSIQNFSIFQKPDVIEQSQSYFRIQCIQIILILLRTHRQQKKVPNCRPVSEKQVSEVSNTLNYVIITAHPITFRITRIDFMGNRREIANWIFFLDVLP